VDAASTAIAKARHYSGNAGARGGLCLGAGHVAKDERMLDGIRHTPSRTRFCAGRSARPRARLRSPRMFDELESERAPWRKVDADPGQLRPVDVVLCMLYAPVRAVGAG
jgi:hypothetical protein